MEPGFFPLDNELQLLPGSLTPTQHEHLVHLGTWIPFARASQMLERMLGVHVSEATARRMTEQVGKQMETVQTEESLKPGNEDPCGTTEKRLAMSADGAYVPLVGGEWAEVRTVAIGEVGQVEEADQRAADQDSQDVHVTHLSYFSRITSASSFADLAEGEMQRREVRQATAVCAVADGQTGYRALSTSNALMRYAFSIFPMPQNI
ncbi:hypothetical protein [Ktedonobacter racemifer]|uniref:Uncharacterized protein n=1 Tax=Ktedonobacter racemifer DSM 44963 TaxID=485913 RepID=D6TU57_KTERA|nr:hypothetical protein [Ktedonobacter racemifer]EFH83958.1 hypothetical protein Krac_4963 [Ktedonobacter racemifer DSM 44963]